MGFGVYGAGGASSSYENVRVGGLLTSVTGDYSTDIKIIENRKWLWPTRSIINWSIGGYLPSDLCLC